jgi:hypothetical protein
VCALCVVSTHSNAACIVVRSDTAKKCVTRFEVMHFSKTKRLRPYVV